LSPFPERGPGISLYRHDPLRRQHVPDHRLRARVAAPPRGRDRRPLRLLPLRLARAPGLGADLRLAALAAAPHDGTVAHRRLLRDLDLRSALPRPGVPDVVSDLA